MTTPMQPDYLEQLNVIVSRPGFRREVSFIKTDICQVYDPFDDIWKESDDHFRERIKGELNENER